MVANLYREGKVGWILKRAGYEVQLPGLQVAVFPFRAKRGWVETRPTTRSDRVCVLAPNRLY